MPAIIRQSAMVKLSFVFEVIFGANLGPGEYHTEEFLLQHVVKIYNVYNFAQSYFWLF